MSARREPLLTWDTEKPELTERSWQLMISQEKHSDNKRKRTISDPESSLLLPEEVVLHPPANVHSPQILDETFICDNCG